MDSPEVVVGIDGSPQSIAAARWAADEALIRRARLRLVTVVARWANEMPERSKYTGVGIRVRAEVDRGLAEAGEAVRKEHPTLAVVGERRSGDPVPALVATSKAAALLVVGAHGAGSVHDLVLGSVAGAVAAGSDCPVVVHREHRGQARRIVVGVDLLTPDQPIPPDSAAVRFAITEARARGSHVQLMTACAECGSIDAHDPGCDGAQEVRALSRRMTELVDYWSRCAGSLSVSGSVVAGHPVDALVEASDQADLLVVGRGQVRRSRWPIDSATRAVLYHAKSPVAVVPGSSAASRLADQDQVRPVSRRT